ncbi:hypothetical protein EUGRSUZ_D01588 [Eucalyptus grandis]|uniref:Uncharacterized protein n=2 Tax=Eucalyptus grandis TaxID=71139 RepID=A0ACC3KW70_EUCGR|nr:hypothetical protein EUGRSUZ_D01588 [Eucalyptus grandis]
MSLYLLRIKKKVAHLNDSKFFTHTCTYAHLHVNHCATFQHCIGYTIPKKPKKKKRNKQGPVLAQGPTGGIMAMVFSSTFESGSFFVIARRK